MSTVKLPCGPAQARLGDCVFALRFTTGIYALTSLQPHFQSSIIATLPEQASKHLCIDQSTGLCPHKVTKAKGHIPVWISFFFQVFKETGA